MDELRIFATCQPLLAGSANRLSTPVCLGYTHLVWLSSCPRRSTDFNVFRAGYTIVNIIQVCTFLYFLVCRQLRALRAPLAPTSMTRKVLIDNPIEQQITLRWETLFVAAIRFWMSPVWSSLVSCSAVGPEAVSGAGEDGPQRGN
jgi:hypothetical protein